MVRGIAALLVGSCALISAVVRYENYVTKGTVDWSLLLQAALAAAIGLALTFVRRRGLPIGFIGTALAAVAIVVTGLPELPAWASIDAFGFSPHYKWIVLGFLLFGIPLAGGRSSRGSGTASLTLFVALCAFSGPFFVRAPKEFFPLLAFAAGTTALAHTSGQRRAPWQVPFALLYIALVILTLLPAANAEDLHRHLGGWSSILAAGVPLLVLGFGPIDSSRARIVAWAFVIMAGLGGVCAAITIAEGSYYFSFAHAVGTRLRLFGQDPNIVAPYLAVAPPIILALLLTTRSWVSRGVLTVALALVLASVKLTGSKTSLAATALGIGLFAVLAIGTTLWRSKGRRKWVAACAIALAVLSGVGGFLVKDKVVAKLRSDEAIQFRMYLWSTAKKAIAEEPWLGYGLQTREPLMVYAESSDLDGRPKDTHPHQLFLNMAMGAGIPAAVLLGLLILWFALRMTIAAPRLEDRGDRLLAVSMVGSGLALLLANMLDQGLSLNTPLPLHFGMLLGIGSLLVLKARKTPLRATPFAARIPFVAATSTAGMAVILLNGLALCGERLTDWTRLADQQNRNEDADHWSELSTRLNPWSLALGMERVRILSKLGRPDDAIEKSWALTRQHPLSYGPWDEINGIHFIQGRLQAAMEAADEARKRDPTGPKASAWLLRRALVYLHTGRQGLALETMAESFRYDYATADNLTWFRDASEEWYYDGQGTAPKIYMRAILEKNRKLIPKMCKEDWVRARRIATTIAKMAEKRYIFDIAKQAIQDFKKHSPHPWMALHIIEEQIREKETKLLEEKSGVKMGGRERTFQEDEFVDEKGEAAIDLARGDNFYANGEPQRALMAYERGLENLYDMYSEKEYAKKLISGAFRSAIRAGEFRVARRWLRTAIYFQRTPTERIALLLEMSQAEAGNGEYLSAMKALEDTEPYVRSLNPAQAKASMQQLAAVLEPNFYLNGEPRKLAVALLERLKDCPPGLALHGFVLRIQGNFDGFRKAFMELEAIDPAWSISTETGK